MPRKAHLLLVDDDPNTLASLARALGLERSHLYKKYRQLGFDLQSLRKPE